MDIPYHVNCRPLLLAYRSLVDCLWNYDHQTLFSMVEKQRSSLETPTPDTKAVSTNEDAAGRQLDVKYSQGALSVTIQTPLVTAQLLQVSRVQRALVLGLYALG